MKSIFNLDGQQNSIKVNMYVLGKKYQINEWLNVDEIKETTQLNRIKFAINKSQE